MWYRKVGRLFFVFVFAFTFLFIYFFFFQLSMPLKIRYYNFNAIRRVGLFRIMANISRFHSIRLTSRYNSSSDVYSLTATCDAEQEI